MDLKPRFAKGGIQTRKNKKLKLVSLYTSEEEQLKKISTSLILNQKASDEIYFVRGYCVSEEIELKMSKDFLGQFMQYYLVDECVFFTDCKLNQHVFIFDFGVIIFWNYTPYQEDRIINKFSKFYLKRLSVQNITKEQMMVQKKLSNTSRIEQNTIFLTTDDINEKFSQSYSLAQSLKLEYYEDKVDKTIQGAKGVPKRMALYGEINLSQKEVYKKIGNIIVLRSSINLISGMLDLPDCFWENDICEQIYNRSKEYYNMDDRIEIINNRLDQLKELYDLLNNDLHHKQMSNIKWIVIVLISLEIFIELFWNGLLKNLLGLKQFILYQICLSSGIRLGRHKIIILIFIILSFNFTVFNIVFYGIK